MVGKETWVSLEVLEVRTSCQRAQIVAVGGCLETVQKQLLEAYSFGSSCLRAGLVAIAWWICFF